MEERYYAEYREVEDRHWWFAGRKAVIHRVLAGELGPDGTQRRILDVGSGTGAMLAELSRYGAVEGADADTNAVRFSEARGVAKVTHLTSEALPWEDEEFDLVTAFDVIEHIDDDVAIVREMARVLRPGGVLMLTVPAYRILWGAQDEISHHKRRYRGRELRARVERAGLRVRRLSYFNTLLFAPIAAVRLLRRGKPAADEVRSDFTMNSPGRVNDLLAALFRSEAKLLDHVDLPFGSRSWP